MIVTLTLFLPVALEQYARDNGRATPDLTMPCAASTDDSDAGCKVLLGGSWIDTTSFRCATDFSGLFALTNVWVSLYVNAGSVIVQALVVISMGKIADRRQSISCHVLTSR